MERRNAGQTGREDQYVRGTPDDPYPLPARRWQEAVHRPGLYDLQIDTSILSPEQAAATIRAHLDAGEPCTALQQLASRRR